MAQIDKKSSSKGACDFIITSIGACLADPEEKKKPPCVVVCYKVGVDNKNISFLTMPYPSKKPYTAGDFISAIKQAEGVKNVTYIDASGRPKDIYLCRDDSGRVVDAAERDYEKNRYGDGFAEVLSSKLKFAVDSVAELSGKNYKKFQLKITMSYDSRYESGSYEYAATNAYNACLLGYIFESEELRLETKNKRKVKIEVRNAGGGFVDETVLFVGPTLREADGLVDYYTTEEFAYINGDDVSRRAFKIAYTNRIGNYELIRI